MSSTQSGELLDRWRQAARAPFQGWDFSRLAGRMVDEEPPWSYPELVRAAMRNARSVLDMGTAGGEVLSSLSPDWPSRVVATEGWAPNLTLARDRLEPLGVKVLAYDSDHDQRLPLPDAELDLIVNRHEAFDAEVARVLGPGGRFLTQQVGQQNLRELTAVLGPPAIPPTVSLGSLRALLVDAGLRVERAEDWLGATRFRDVDALVYFLTAVPFTAPTDFSVDGYADQLLRIHGDGPGQGRPIVLTQHRFLIVAVRPVGTAAASIQPAHPAQ